MGCVTIGAVEVIIHVRASVKFCHVSSCFVNTLRTDDADLRF
jgi:hypothetical protein